MKRIDLGHRPCFSEGNMKLRLLHILSSCAGIAAGSAPAWAMDGAALYKTHCSACHEAGEQRAPARSVLKQLSPQQIITALEKGAMIAQGAERSRAERRVLAEYLSESLSMRWRIRSRSPLFVKARIEASRRPPPDLPGTAGRSPPRTLGSSPPAPRACRP